jgi:hypothetical protein
MFGSPILERMREQGRFTPIERPRRQGEDAASLKMAICHHESGHGIVAAALGIDVTKLIVETDGGQCFARCNDDWRNLVVLVAGQITDEYFSADEHFVGRLDRSSDNEGIAALSRRLDPADPGRIVAEAESAAYGIIRQHEDSLLDLARRLFDAPTGILNADQIGVALSYCRPFPPPPEPSRRPNNERPRDSGRAGLGRVEQRGGGAFYAVDTRSGRSFGPFRSREIAERQRRYFPYLARP